MLCHSNQETFYYSHYKLQLSHPAQEELPQHACHGPRVHSLELSQNFSNSPQPLLRTYPPHRSTPIPIKAECTKAYTHGRQPSWTRGPQLQPCHSPQPGLQAMSPWRALFRKTVPEQLPMLPSPPLPLPPPWLRLRACAFLLCSCCPSNVAQSLFLNPAMQTNSSCIPTTSTQPATTKHTHPDPSTVQRTLCTQKRQHVGLRGLSCHSVTTPNQLCRQWCRGSCCF